MRCPELLPSCSCDLFLNRLCRLMNAWIGVHNLGDKLNFYAAEDSQISLSKLGKQGPCDSSEHSQFCLSFLKFQIGNLRDAFDSPKLFIPHDRTIKLPRPLQELRWVVRAPTTVE